MPEAARLGDTIGHSNAMAGLIGGTIIGSLISAAGGIAAGFLFAAGVAASCIGVGVLLIGASIAVGMAAGALGEKARDACVSAGASSRSPSGTITSGSANVFINNKAAAIATRSLVACSKEAGVRQMAQGSDSVFINSLPASRVGDKTTCDAAVMTGSPNVIIGGGTATTENITPEIPKWAYNVSDATMFLAGFTSFGGAAYKALGALPKLFSKIPNAAKIGKILCRLSNLAVGASLVGIMSRPVEVITGQKFLNDDDELDFVFEAEFPLYWQRSYLSSYQYESVLGQGWNLFWESRLTRVEGGILWRDLSGDIIPFPDVPEGHRCFCPDAQSWLIHTEGGEWEIRDAGELVYHYATFDNEGGSWLSHIRDNVGNEQRFHYNDQHQMVNITGNGGLNLHCDYAAIDIESNAVSRLTSVWRELYDGERIRLCHYQYDENARLTGVNHRSDHFQRQFGWTEHGIMAWHQDKRGLRCDYEWEQTEDGLWRVINQKTSEGAGYRLDYDDKNQTRTAHWYDGSHTIWKLNEEHQIIHCTDRNGTEHHILWDEFGLPNGYKDAEGHTRQGEWDKLGRLLSMTDGNGDKTQWQYQNDTDRLAFIFWPDGAEMSLDYDEFGRLVGETSPLKQITRYHYHLNTLRPYQCFDAKGGESRFMWNGQGQLIRHTDCSGQSSDWRYDHENRLSRFTNALMESVCYNYDENGQLVRVIYPDGSTEQMEWDSADQLVYHQRNQNTSRAWEYNLLGQIVSTTDRLQRQVRYQYNPEGYLLQIENANGGRYLLNRDAEGRLIEEIRPDDTLIQYEYNAAGLLSTEKRMGDRIFQQPVHAVYLNYDPAGNLTQRETRTDSYQYQWDNMGRLLEANRMPNAAGKQLGLFPNTVSFEYDALGRVIREQNGEDILKFSHDEMDNLTELILPQGDTLRWLYYGSGHLSAIRHNQQMITEFERDNLHRETSRIQGKLFQFREYDPLGRRISQYSVRDKSTPIGQGKPWRAWHYDQQDDLCLMEDHYRGWVEYLYDSESRLKKVTSVDSFEEMLWYDRADNLLERPQSMLEKEAEQKKHLTPQGDRLAQWNQWRYEHDAHGNVISRGMTASNKQAYRYDGDNRLILAEGNGMKASYHYDALGRRIRKVVTTWPTGTPQQEHTDFVWHGLKLLQERNINTGKIHTYCYESDDSYTPLSCIVAKGSVRNYFWYHTDINGAPLEITDEEGKIAWSGKYDAFGAVNSTTIAYFTDKERSPRDFDQNLRYAGQYFDKETGLHFNTYRYYAPEIGRFITPDPIGLNGGLNLYTYAPNPIGWIDPWGLAKDKTYTVTRNMNAIEAEKTRKAGGLVPGETNGVPDRRAKWVNIDGANYDRTTNPKPTHTATLDVTKEGYDMLNGKDVVEAGQESKQTGKILHKPTNEPGARGIGRDLLDKFNKTIKKINVNPISTCGGNKKRRK
ncbi:Similar to Rhs-family protein [Xenorhabdus bovienii str. oregonense]|uniref:Similar to Rhs-family protein n=1 Tax=Xenorhabdus bovienii str. oregonense TaxID=1398202 RepID=A0A077P4B6_XENBV|nr:RHS repeat-associated core domain-containing protein [Xenorhabdus bovienii]CDH05423.1 Similar to Rhs-family protein [Xenorhabdus bovienii str. oregonense]